MIYVFLANGFEEIEALSVVDILRRAGIETKTVGIGSIGTVRGANGIIVDTDEKDCAVDMGQIDGIVLPGGMPGAENLYESSTVRETVNYCAENGKLICAICAAPIILGRLGLLDGKEAICYPGFEKELKGAKISEKYVCKDGNIITAKGPGAALDFAFEIVNYLKGSEKVKNLKKSMQCKENG